jgi:hypothetical protein
LSGAYAGIRRELVIVEPGVGLGSFVRHMLIQSDLPELFNLRFVGADVSAEMIQGCQSILRSIRPKPSWKRVSIELHSGANLLALESCARQLRIRVGEVDVVFASQVEHYFPNAATSPLAVKLRAAGLPGSTKTQFRHWAFEQLRPGGFYLSLDDYRSGDAERDAAQTRAWDAFVVEQLSDPEFLETTAATYPAVASSLRRAYNRAFGSDVLLRKAASARQRRRSVCQEETATLQSAVADLEKLYGPESVGVEEHSLRESHAMFYLLSGQRGGR